MMQKSPTKPFFPWLGTQQDDLPLQAECKAYGICVFPCCPLPFLISVHRAQETPPISLPIACSQYCYPIYSLKKASTSSFLVVYLYLNDLVRSTLSVLELPIEYLQRMLLTKVFAYPSPNLLFCGSCLMLCCCDSHPQNQTNVKRWPEWKGFVLQHITI